MRTDINKRPLKAALIIGISFFVGFSLIFLLRFIYPAYGVLVLLDLFYFITSGQIYIGLGLSFLIGLITYLTFRLIIKRGISKKKLGWSIFFVSAIAMIIGFFTFLPTQIFVMERGFGKERLVGGGDINNDGRIDKWVYSTDVYDRTTRIDYDTNFDGKPDIKEYCGKNDKLIKREIDTNFDGKIDKVENYKK